MPRKLKRVPEKDLVMSDIDSVSFYDKEGLLGFLRPVYLMGADIITAIFPKKGVCLDIGCGSGRYTIEYTTRIPLLKVVAFDLSPRMIRLAKKNLRESSLIKPNLNKQINFEVGNMLNLERFRSQSFDAIVCSYTLHHSIDKDEVIYVLDQIKRILKPEGALYIYDLIRPDTIEALKLIEEKFLRDYPSIFRIDTVNSLRASFSAKELIEIVRQSSLNNLEHFISSRGVIILKLYERNRSKYEESKSLKEFISYSKSIKARYISGLKMFKEAGLDLHKLSARQ
ncbi:MAG: Methyltransferase type 11 [Candidatus Roizmanbacteria bacterium GW2011_GWA2_37_7]|uniref:Methyltransferase type 11 n=1 Tax=Candidatus Roizmanbacteria bacterium GW2011_GWA2_37_7 TaxID=1618481 RepID=A0A0G0H6F2_9BACT|nr:MAG: Methyltransferase type 11 [Candidatus Roizmanbacteria bacterium GW2011_GWA2_37_7]